MLYIHENDLSGSIPAELKTMGKKGNTHNLTRLIMSGNDLSGSIPPELGELSKLQFLWLHNNDLTGTIPADENASTEAGKGLARLTQLTNFRMTGNELKTALTLSVSPSERTMTEDGSREDLHCIGHGGRGHRLGGRLRQQQHSVGGQGYRVQERQFGRGGCGHHA